MNDTNDQPPAVTDRDPSDFWRAGPGFDDIDIRVVAPSPPLVILEQLGPSPFERGEFPVIGFLATTYDKVSRHALEGTTRGES